jgi:hypothetical protein
MKVRLSIAVDGGNAVQFAHGGPIIRIGRDPQCELVLQGESSKGVSRQHARIELTAKGARISDTGSSNGTLLNGQMLDGPAPLAVGDTIQMGYTGATLTVLELDLGKPPTVAAVAPPPATPPPQQQRTALLVGLAAVALLSLVVAGVVLLRKPRTTDEHLQAAGTVAPVAPVTSPEVHPPVGAGSPRLASPATDPIKPPSPPEPVKPPPLPPGPGTQAPPGKTPNEKMTTPAPSSEVKEVGSYVALDQWVSVLLQRQGEGFPWTVLRPESRVSTAYTLVSLPGYRSLVALDSGVHLTLWGDLPEFSAFPPVLESVVMLHNPAAGVDLDFTLDRGRVVIANRKASGSARVHLRLLREEWDLELPETDSEVAVELWTLLRGASSAAEPQPSVACVGLFTKGRLQVKTPKQNFDLGARSRLSWTSQEPSAYHRVPLPELPAWWVKPPDRQAPPVKKALRSLLDWSDLLGGSNIDPTKVGAGSPRPAIVSGTPIVTTIKTQVEEVRDPDNQDVGIFFLAALDEMEPLVGFLKDRQNSNVRGVTQFALQTWLSRGSQHASDLARIFERRGDSKDKAELIVRLLHFYPPEALDKRKTYEDLIGWLNDDNLLVRDLAFWHLEQIGVGGRLPEEARKIAYDPTWEAEKRRSAVDQWKKLLSEGKVPVPQRR